MQLRTTIMRLLLMFSVCSALATVASAQGVIVPGPCRRCPDGPQVVLPRALPIKSIKIDTKISSQVATTHVEQVFRNDTPVVLEGTYLFPIPESASIAEFAIWDGDRRLVGEVRTREEARRIYDEIVRRQGDRGLPDESKSKAKSQSETSTRPLTSSTSSAAATGARWFLLKVKAARSRRTFSCSTPFRKR